MGKFKFNVGDKIIGNDKASLYYSHTTKGWVGYVMENVSSKDEDRYGSPEIIRVSKDKNGSKSSSFHVRACAFDLVAEDNKEDWKMEQFKIGDTVRVRPSASTYYRIAEGGWQGIVVGFEGNDKMLVRGADRIAPFLVKKIHFTVVREKDASIGVEVENLVRAYNKGDITSYTIKTNKNRRTMTLYLYDNSADKQVKICKAACHKDDVWDTHTGITVLLDKFEAICQEVKDKDKKTFVEGAKIKLTSYKNVKIEVMNTLTAFPTLTIDKIERNRIDGKRYITTNVVRAKLNEEYLHIRFIVPETDVEVVF